MCEGVCVRCREKVQWRFRFDRYKPLKTPASCQGCKQKSVTKAYRNLCDKCANAKKVCPGCCGELTVDEVVEDPLIGSSSSAASKKKSDGSKMKVDNEEDEEEDEDEEDEDEEEDGEEEDGEEDEDDEGDEDEEEEEDTGEEKLPSNTQGDWDEQRFLNIAAKKYSKNRVVGSTNDKPFSLTDS